MRCKAKSKRTGFQCKRHASIGREVCRMHGGATPKGIESKNFKHGRSSKYLPDCLAIRLDDLEKNRKFGDLYTLIEQINLTEVRISILVEHLNSGNSQTAWKIVNKSFKKLKDAIKNRNTEKIRNTLFDFEEAIKEGNKDFRSWNELFKTQNHYKRLIESERKLMIKERYMISIDDVLLIMSTIADVIKRTVSDKHKLHEIRNEFEKLAYQLGLIGNDS